ncbi:MAG: hypothetical protein ABI862_10455 [Ilumatobacteraceae bacterium]
MPGAAIAQRFASEGAAVAVRDDGVAVGHHVRGGRRRSVAQQAWHDQRAAQRPLGVLPSPLDIANTALFLCSDEAASLTGSTPRSAE